MKIVYLTSMLPYGHQEAFFLPELQELQRLGHEVILVPVRPRGTVVHDAARAFTVLAHGAIDWPIVAGAMRMFLRAPLACLRAAMLVLKSRSPAIFLKNALILPKALWLSAEAMRIGTNHVHSQWAGTSSTIGLLVHEITGIPWSMTAHRWDIRENNLLPEKVTRANFVRVISELGADIVRRFAPTAASSVYVGRVGVALPEIPAPRKSRDVTLKVVCVASLVPVKGHRYLLEAVAKVRGRGLPIMLECAGGGPLKDSLREYAEKLGIAGHVRFLGVVEHDKLLGDLRGGRWDCTVLPSIRTEDGVEEGVPVALMESMAAGIPVVSTRTGAIAELLDGGAGQLVADKDPDSLAASMATLCDVNERERYARAGRARIADEFDVNLTVSEFLRRMHSASGCAEK